MYLIYIAILCIMFSTILAKEFEIDNSKITFLFIYDENQVQIFIATCLLAVYIS